MDCSKITTTYPDTVYFPGSPEYAASQNSYFAAFENELSPACIVQPTTAAEVAQVIKTVKDLSPQLDTKQIAVRSGGHTAWAGSANIAGNGLTIDLSLMESVTLDSTDNVVSIGPGSKWAKVYETLATKGLAVVGGRVGKVGVGGLTLGGGLSYFSAATGFVCDNVINFEVVLSSGEIIEVNENSHPDLFVALKGGGNNFGIVTRIDFPTFKQGEMWGGTTFYGNNTYPALVQAFCDFAADPNPDDKAAIIIGSNWITGMGEIPVSNLYYTAPTSDPPALAPLINIQPQLQSTRRFDSLIGLAQEQSNFSTDGARQWFFTTGFRADVQFMTDIREFFLETAQNLQSQPGFVISLVFQPITKGIIQNSLSRGKNSLGLSVSDGPFVVCLVNTVHSDSASDDLVSAGALDLIRQIEDLAEKRHLSSRYRFYNYAFENQKVIEGYGPESVANLKAVSKKYDPTGFFQKVVTGGFKVSDAAA